MSKPSAKGIMIDLKAQLNSIVAADNEIDYAAILNFGQNVDGADVIIAASNVNPKRPVDQERLIKTIAVERDSYHINPLDQDKLVIAKTGLFRLCPVGIGDKIIMFACYERGDTDTFRAAAHKYRQTLVDKVRDWDEAL